MHIKKVKVLQKKMTYDETIEFIETKKKWRLPHNYEIDKLGDLPKSFRISGDLFVDEESSYSATNTGDVNCLFKLPVVLVPSVDGFATATVFILEDKLSQYELALIMAVAHAPFVNSKVLIDKQFLGIAKNQLNNDKLHDLYDIMSDNDVLLINK